MLNQQHHPGAPVSLFLEGAVSPVTSGVLLLKFYVEFCSNSTAAFDFTLYTEFFFHQDSG